MKLLKHFLHSRSVKLLFLRRPEECETAIFFFFHLCSHCAIIGSKNFKEMSSMKWCITLLFKLQTETCVEFTNVHKTMRNPSVHQLSAFYSSVFPYLNNLNQHVKLVLPSILLMKLGPPELNATTTCNSKYCSFLLISEL